MGDQESKRKGDASFFSGLQRGLIALSHHTCLLTYTYNTKGKKPSCLCDFLKTNLSK